MTEVCHANPGRAAPHLDPTLDFLSILNSSLNSLKLNDPSSTVHRTVDRSDGDREDQWVEVLSLEPRAALFHNFLSQEECEHLIKLGKPHMKRSKVVDDNNIEGKYDSPIVGNLQHKVEVKGINPVGRGLVGGGLRGVRTSSGMCLARGHDKTIQSIERRIADFTSLPIENGEALQILHYEVGQKYDNHTDYFKDKSNLKRGGQRMVTVLMYLSDVEEGGQTVFPLAKPNISVVPGSNELSKSVKKRLSKSCKKGLSVKPKTGDALLFWSMKPDGSVDPLSLHGGSPVIKGDKWCATKWIHVKEFK